MKKTSMINRYADADLKKSCCRRAFLRGAFLSIGYISDPNKGYDLEFVCSSKKHTELIKEYIFGFGIEMKQTVRNGVYVLYAKDAETVVDILNVLGAHQSLMKIENLRVEKDFRNLINRQVNCETANLAKTVSAASKQIRDILKIGEYMGFEKLPDQLRKMAEVRIQYPDKSMAELGELLNPPVGKSGVNHRLRRLSEIADTIQE